MRRKNGGRVAAARLVDSDWVEASARTGLPSS